MLIVFGLAIASWYGYQWWHGLQSVTDTYGKMPKTVHDSQDYKKKEPASQPDLPVADKGKEDKKEQHAPKTPDFSEGEQVAKLTIPKLEKSFDVFWGTDNDTLSKGVGEYVSEWTVPPGQEGHTVLSGHNNTVFENLGDLEDGDSLYMSYKGKDYEYNISKAWITTEDDRSVIVQKDDPTLTLTTCYPFGYIKYTPKRYIVQATLVDQGKLLNN